MASVAAIAHEGMKMIENRVPYLDIPQSCFGSGSGFGSRQQLGG